MVETVSGSGGVSLNTGASSVSSGSVEIKSQTMSVSVGSSQNMAGSINFAMKPSIGEGGSVAIVAGSTQQPNIDSNSSSDIK